MKIFLLIPPTKLSDSYGGLKSFSNPQPSIGIAYIAACLKEAGHAVRVYDGYATSASQSCIQEQIRSFGPDMVGISCLSTSYEVVREIFAQVRTEFPNIVRVAGNLHASLFAESMVRDGICDFVVHKEGEIAFVRLCAALEQEDSTDGIPGLTYLDGERVVETADNPFIEDIDSLPFPAWDLFSMNLYSSDPRTEIVPGASEIQILATRGCPNQCTFCSSRTARSLGTKYRMRSPQNICDEIEHLIERYQARVLTFMDLAFPLVKSHAMALFEEIQGRGLNKKIVWCSECRVKPLDEETVVGMKASGCVRVNFGIESGNQGVLNNIKKNFTLEDVERATDLVTRHGIEADGMFMLGLPGEDRQTILETINFACRLPLRYSIFNLFVPYPGSQLYEELMSQEKIHFDSYADFTSYGGYSGRRPVFVPDALTSEQLIRLQQYAMRRFYFRPKFLLGELKRLRLRKIKHYLDGLKVLVFPSAKQG